MAITNSIENFQMHVNEDFLAKARALEPKRFERTVCPVKTVELVPRDGDIAAIPKSHSFDVTAPMGRDDEICLDFGEHVVGTVSFRLTSVGSPPDAPAFLRLRFAEIPYELAADVGSVHSEISRSWIQEELLHVDDLPAHVTLPRRYAFRYLRITVEDTSPKYRVVIGDVRCLAVTSADMRAVPPLHTDDPTLAALDRVSLATMRDCMQSVFEDGPKRDRRLWVGDLRLQALTNAVTFKNYALVKRCLYLFAALTQNEGRVGACLFHRTEQVDDTSLFDYSLLFVSTLYDYYVDTGDRQTLQELFPTALTQIQLSMRELDAQGIVADRDSWWCFLDWGEDLNKQAGAHAILIYAAKQAANMARSLGDENTASSLLRQVQSLTDAALSHLYDAKKGFFVSGANRQVSWVSQIWFVLAGVFTREQNAALLKHLTYVNPPFRPVTPYAVHYLVQALIESGLKAEALDCMKSYWGGMLRAGADTFFEVYDPDDKYASPYGSRLLNSFCHAWSGTPAYFIRKYFDA